MLKLGRKTAICAAGLWAASAMALATPASAEGLFEAIFGGMFQSRSAPREVSSYAETPALFGNDRPSSTGTVATGDVGGSYSAHCVRLCDGFHFPIQRNAGASSADVCRSFCPASKTAVYSGSKIDNAVTSNGSRYSDLDNAFAYRERVVDSCTCNGKTSFGLAHLDVKSDQTLRPGDIVATNNGFETFRGRTSKTAEFTPINPASSPMAKHLAETKIKPAAPVTAPTPVASNDEATPARRRQASR